MEELYPYDVVIPKPLGEFFMHSYRPHEMTSLEHHETTWLINKAGEKIAMCRQCGTKALFINVPVEEFYGAAS